MARFFFHFRSAFFFLIFFLIALLVRLDGAGQGWASVDTRIILILHPMMANFDYSRGLFFRSNFASKKPEQLQAELEKGWKQAKPLIDSLLLKQSKAMDQRASIMLRRDETLSNMRSKNPGATAERAKDFHKLLAEYENRYSGFLASCDTQLDQIGNEIKAAQESALSPVYLTSVETEKQLSAIKGEISGLISQTANESGIAVVMDTTLSMRPIKKAENLYAIPSYPDPADNLSPSLFQLFSNWEIPQGIQLNGPDGRPIDAAKHMAPVIAANMAQNLKRYLEFQPYLTQTAAAFTPGQIFLVGGYDLTPQIAGKIFSKYRIPTEIQNSFIGLIRDYCSFERAKYSR